MGALGPLGDASLLTAAHRSPRHFSIKQFFDFSVPYIFLKIIEDLKELLFIWVVPSDICNELKLKLRHFLNVYVLIQKQRFGVKIILQFSIFNMKDAWGLWSNLSPTSNIICPPCLESGSHVKGLSTLLGSWRCGLGKSSGSDPPPSVSWVQLTFGGPTPPPRVG